MSEASPVMSEKEPIASEEDQINSDKDPVIPEENRVKCGKDAAISEERVMSEDEDARMRDLWKRMVSIHELANSTLYDYAFRKNFNAMAANAGDNLRPFRIPNMMLNV